VSFSFSFFELLFFICFFLFFTVLSPIFSHRKKQRTELSPHQNKTKEQCLECSNFTFSKELSLRHKIRKFKKNEQKKKSSFRLQWFNHQKQIRSLTTKSNEVYELNQSNRDLQQQLSIAHEKENQMKKTIEELTSENQRLKSNLSALGEEDERTHNFFEYLQKLTCAVPKGLFSSTSSVRRICIAVARQTFRSDFLIHAIGLSKSSISRALRTDPILLEHSLMRKHRLPRKPNQRVLFSNRVMDEIIPNVSGRSYSVTDKNKNQIFKITPLHGKTEDISCLLSQKLPLILLC